MKIVETCNFDGDYPDEKFVEGLPYLNDSQANVICKAINSVLSGDNHPRYWKVVQDNYELSPGFEP
jgi:hypothetical protein